MHSCGVSSSTSTLSFVPLTLMVLVIGSLNITRSCFRELERERPSPLLAGEA